jgi:hypothetical protein
MRPLQDFYERTRTRIVWLVRQACSDQPAAATASLPACPSWSVHDVLAHVTGVGADVLVGNVQDAGSPEWTAAQLEARRGVPIGEVLAEWDDVGPKLAAMIDNFPGRYGDQVIADLAIHEQDIRGALDLVGARDSSVVAVATQFLLDVVVSPGARALGLGPLEVRAGPRRRIVGTGEPPCGDPEAAIQAALLSPQADPAPAAPVICRVTAAPFELFRALTGRRSPAQVRCFDWSGDPEPYLALCDLWPFTMRTTDLVE